MTFKTVDVFTPGVFPTHTYYNRREDELEKNLREGLAVHGMLISLSGPSKSGKTVLVERVAGPDNLIHITGAGISSTADLWSKIFRWMGDPEESSESSTQMVGGEIQGTGKASGKLLLASAEAGFSAKVSGADSQTRTSYRKKKGLEQVVQELAGSDFVIFIDDFHYIDRNVQGAVASELKEAIRQNVKVVTASIPFHSDDVIRANSDLRGRVITIDIDYWTVSELLQIPKLGMPLLKIQIDEKLQQTLATEAAGSPQLMQQILLSLCFEHNITGTQSPEKHLSLDSANLPRVFQRASMSTNYSSLVGKLLQGPRTRGVERNIYPLQDGTEGDVYRVLLKSLATDPPLLLFKYSEMQQRIQSVCGNSVPSGSSVIGACAQIDSITSDLLNDRIIEWDSAYDALNIRDPYLLFYLRWSQALSS